MREIVEEKFKEIFGTEGKFKTYFMPNISNLEENVNDNLEANTEENGIYATARRREDNIVNFYLLNDEDKGIISMQPSPLIHNECEGLIKYPKEILEKVVQKGYNIEYGFDIVYCISPEEETNNGNLMKKMTLTVINELCNLDVSMEDLNKKDEESEDEEDKEDDEEENLDSIITTGEKLQIQEE